jgi:hypothetical protein
LKLSLPEPVEGNIPAENHLRQAQVAMNCVTPIVNKIIQAGLFWSITRHYNFDNLGKRPSPKDLLNFYSVFLTPAEH